MKLTGNFLHYDQKNLNGRIYTKECAEDIVKQFNKMKKKGKVFGELGYPQDSFAGINLANISHDIEDLHLNEERKTIEGTIKILDTHQGKVVQEMYKAENMVGLSCRSRGTGQVNEKGEIEDFKIISFDLVSDRDAFENIAPDDFLKQVKEEQTKDEEHTSS